MRSKVNVQIVHAFADGKVGGNPAGLVLEADRLSTADKLTIAAQVGLSETAFVSASRLAAIRLEFFTPQRQIAHCGHATIATFSYLRQLGYLHGDRSSKETIDGIRQIFFEGDLAFMEQTGPVFSNMMPADEVPALQALGLSRQDLLPGHPLEMVHTGNSFLIIPVKEASRLKAVNPNPKMIEALSTQYDLIGFYAYAPATEAFAVATTRMFAPLYGIAEEAATGMAAGPLAAYLDKYDRLAQDPIQIIQGQLMELPSPSRILVKLEKRDGKIQGLYAGGTAYLAGQLEIELYQNAIAQKR